jgi:hypothetical protein
MKPSFVAFVGAILAIALAAVQPALAARVVSISLCESISQPGSVPVNVKDKFSIDTKAIHAVIYLADAEAGAILKGAWISVDAIETPDYEIDAAEATVSVDGEASAHFSLSKPTNGWPVGNYRFDFYINGKHIAFAPFSIGVAQKSKAFEGSGAATEKADAASSGSKSQSKPNLKPKPEPSPKAGEDTGYGGTYTLKNGQVTVTIALRHTDDGVLKGVLFSTTGMQYLLEGAVQEGVAVGGCYNNQGGAYFEASLSGDQLAFSLIEPDANKMPDYNKARQFVFTRQSSSIDPSIAEMLEQGQTPDQQDNGAAAQYPGMPGSGGQAGSSELMQRFAGTWVNMTKNTETRVTLAPDGSYYENYDASYSGTSSDGYGNQDMAWGTAGQQQAQGQWQAQGTAEQGTITIMFSNGNTREIQYRVHVENGETYWNEYWFNGDLYGRER